MKVFYNSILAILATTVFSVTAMAQETYFSDIAESSIVIKGKRTIIPQKFRTVSADFDRLRDFLWSLPSEQNVLNRNLTPEILLPMPDGRFARFHVWESSIQAPALQARFPEIRTFCGQGIDDPYATIRLDLNPYFGFHAQVLTINGNFYIDPYSRNDVDNYISYFTADHIKPNYFVCYTNEPSLPRPGEINAGPCRGTSLKTYRTAVACTGEYAVAVGGTTAGALHAAIVTSVNRVSGVYEKEIAVRLELVANNNLVEYLSAATDPFNGNNNANTLINESQTVITANIGTANYDFGHTFSTGGGGLAQLGCVCNSGNKARGITGSPSPTGDAYDIDYVAHEMGHQLGGNHTFNSNLSSCSGNRASSAAYEVGAGTTIMGYAGICGSDNTQPHSDATFHAISFDEISSYLNAGGASCGTNTPTGNTLPVITSMDNMGANIPLATPFTLTGSATDADGDALSYCWEEWDLGPSTTWNGGNANTSSPLFKSRVPKTSGSRTFPDIAVILANYPINPTSTMGGLKGETLPTLARTMKFRLTVRDNRAGGSGVVSGGSGCQSGYTATFPINTITGTGPFRVSYPNGGESFPGGSIVTVTWDVAGTNAAPINTSKVKIVLSTDGGQNFNTVLLDSTDNDGSEPLNLPIVVTTTARVKVMAVGNVYFDISNANFSITQAAIDFTFNNATTSVSFPCGSANSSVLTLGTNSTGGFSTPINLSASGNPAGTSVTFATNPVNPGSSTDVQLLNTGSLTPGNYTVTVTGVAGSSTKTINLTFTVTPGAGPSIISQPVSSTVCEGTGTSFSVGAGGASAYQWQISTNGGTNWGNITDGTQYSGSATQTLTISNPPAGISGNQYRVIASVPCGSTTSTAAVLTVKAGTAISGQPLNGSACIGNNNTFSVSATGTNLSYQWQSSTDCSNFTDISGATNSSYTVSNSTLAQNSDCYRVVVNGDCQAGPVTSNNATLTVNDKPTVTVTAGGNTQIPPGSSVTLTASSNPAATAYLWYKNNVIIPGATGNSYTVTYSSQADLGAYSAEATDINTCRNQSAPVNITAGIGTLISPNPTAQGYFNLVVPPPAVAATVLMFDSKGALVYKNSNPGSNPIKVRTANLSSGVYMVEILDNKAKKITSGRVVVTHK